MRKDILEGVEIYVINEIKPNYAALAQKYDCDYRTVKRVMLQSLKIKPKISNLSCP